MYNFSLIRKRNLIKKYVEVFYGDKLSAILKNKKKRIKRIKQFSVGKTLLQGLHTT